MVTEPEPGFKSLVDRLEEVRGFFRNADPDHWSEAMIIADYLDTLDDAIEHLEGEKE